MTRATKNIHPSNSNSSDPYSSKAESPFVAIASKTSPMIPIGAKFITHLTIYVMASEKLEIIFFVESDAFFKATPSSNSPS